MKRLLSIIIAFIILLTGCSFAPQSDLSEIPSTTTKQQIEVSDATLMKAVWFSYVELTFVGMSEDEFKTTVSDMFKKVKDARFNAVICQVRANCDAIYPSEYFPFSAAFTGTLGVAPNFDPLQIMVNTAHSFGLEFHAWINPYRISAKSKDYEALPDNSPVYKFLTDQDKYNDRNVLFTEEGMYLNPASSEARNLIVNGIDEILANYDLDGIQFDDYFYPTTDQEFDKVSYDEYKNTVATPLSLADWRRTNVNLLLAEVYKTVHSYEDIVFGVSPAADISSDNTDKNYTQLYADIKLWCSTVGYIDYIAPQLYFGYEYPEKDFRFDTLLDKWCKLSRANGINLYIGLAAYKSGETDADSNEWIENNDILSRQIKDVKEKSTDGIFLYSYSYLFSKKEHNRAEFNALIKELD